MNDECKPSGMLAAKPCDSELRNVRNLVRGEQPCEDRPVCEGEAISTKSKREIHIIPLNYGYNVKIDCHTFAIETPERLIEKLSAYIMDPNGVEKTWFDKKTI